MAITFGQKLREFADQLGACFRQHTAAHCKIVTLGNKYDVYYGRRGYTVIPKTGLATFRTGTILDIIKYIRQCEEYVTADSAGEKKPAAAETPRELAAPTSTVVQDTVTKLVAIYVDGKLLRVEPYLTMYQREPHMAITMQTTLARYAGFPKQLCDVKPLCAVAFAASNDGEKTPSPAEKTCEAAKITSREWATAFVEKNKRFPHAIDYANAGYDQGSQCACTTVGDCVLRDACNGHHCDRNCYTQQLQDYIVMSTTKRQRQPVQPERPQTTEAVLTRINELESSSLKSGKRSTSVYIPKWAEELLLNGIHLSHMRMAMKWKAGSWRPYSIYDLECIWDTAAANLCVE